MHGLVEWVQRRSEAAPPLLRERVLHYVPSVAVASAPSALAGAAWEALAAVEQHAGDRSAALDLLAADALITLALLAQAEDEPDQLAEFAGSLLDEALPAA